MANRRLAAKREQLERAKKEFEEARQKEGRRIGEIALDAGLDEVEASDKELKGAFEEIAHRFRSADSRRSGSGDTQAG